MAIGVKVLKRPERQVSYVRATLKGMALTFKHMFEPKVTLQYPEQKSSTDWSISQRWRGTHRMLTDEQGRVPDLHHAFATADLAPGERRAAARLEHALDSQLERAATWAFRDSFLLGAGIALVALVVVVAPRRRPA